MEKGVQRWIVDISEWNPSPADFSSVISVLPQYQQSFIYRYVKLDDQKRALVSRLLQYALVHEVLDIPYDHIVIRSTVEGKPYVDGEVKGWVDCSYGEGRMAADGYSSVFYIATGRGERRRSLMK